MKRGATDPAEDFRWMRMAIGLAGRSLGRVAPNPAVGAVLVKGGKVLGRGATGFGGRPHAEAIALSQARSRYGDHALAGATAYVSLEPCAHHGHTPPCAEALIAAGITRVVSPIEDPDPRVSGRGFDTLAAAGIAIETGLMAAEARRMNAGFLSVLEHGRPHVILKLAASLDGRIATRSGESRWITGPEARRRVHLMRAQADAVLIGAGTAKADDPMLDIRGLGPNMAQPIRVIADGSLSLSPDSRLARSARKAPVLLLHRPDAAKNNETALANTGVAKAEVAVGLDGNLDLTDALGLLARRDITRLLCEGGGRLAASLLAEGLADELVLFSAGRAFGADGLPAVGVLAFDALDDAPKLSLVSEIRIGGDVMTTWRRET